MQLNHANLAVDDVAATVDFFERYLGFCLRGERSKSFAILDDRHGFTFNLMVGAKGETVAYSRNFHIGFFVPTEAEVRERHRQLTGAGLLPGEVRSYRRGPSGSIGFYCPTPGGFLIEIAAQF